METKMDARILIVDDERSLVHFLRQVLLQEFPGSSVDAAYSGEEALSRLAEGSYDLMMADLRMPGFDGLALIQGVRYLDPDVPIVLMTGYGSESLRRKAARLGVNHYIEKPFEVEDLLAIVRRLLSRRRQADG
jgi:two-component system C4-dicarboxylate transport response regulator DctD